MAGYDVSDSTCSQDATSYIPTKLQTCAANACVGRSYYTTTACTSSTPAPVPTLAPAIAVVPSFPSGSTAVTSGYLYTLNYETSDSHCSTLYGGTLTQLNTCVPYTTNINKNSASGGMDAIGVGYVYQKITAAYDGTTTTTLYYLTTYYSDSACKNIIPDPKSYQGKYTSYNTVTKSKCQGSQKITTVDAASSALPASGVFDK
jgi:hypothetical protein